LKNLLYLLITLVIITSTFFMKPSKENQEVKWGIALHGGAGAISKNTPDSIRDQYLSALETALILGKEMLENGESALDVVEAVVRHLEDDHHFNAGKGAVMTTEGIHELDASIMDGSNLKNGAVAIVKYIKNPVSAARLVMEKTEHVLLSSDGADEFARKMELEMVENDYFTTPERLAQFNKSKKGTVGCVALDKNGNLAAATSTGGRSNKLKGRVGDSPLINAGTYANNKTCAVSATGTGELFITHTVAFNISALMEYKGASLKEAADFMIHKTLKPGDGGVIAIDKDGNIETPFNTAGMYRAAANSNGLYEVKIWE
jgi:L-asparaginase / beta-aspartyl-peptidase